jgi:hypothetical protein
MTSSNIQMVAEALAQFEPSDDETDNVHRLRQLFEGFRTLENRDPIAPTIFALLERFPEAELGSPGPLVHEIEATTYDTKLLRESLRRQPAYLTVWMVNRLLNANPAQQIREMWLSELSAAVAHPKAPEGVREEAREFLQYQSGET